jgi:hypothetical protein
MYCAHVVSPQWNKSDGVAPNDADSKKRATSVGILDVMDNDRVANTYLFPGGMMVVQVVLPLAGVLQTHSGEFAMNDPPARSQSFPSYERAMGTNRPLSNSNVNVHNDPIPFVFSITTVVGAVTLNGVSLLIVFGQVKVIP